MRIELTDPREIQFGDDDTGLTLSPQIGGDEITVEQLKFLREIPNFKKAYLDTGIIIIHDEIRDPAHASKLDSLTDEEITNIAKSLDIPNYKLCKRETLISKIQEIKLKK